MIADLAQLHDCVHQNPSSTATLPNTTKSPAVTGGKSTVLALHCIFYLLIQYRDRTTSG